MSHVLEPLVLRDEQRRVVDLITSEFTQGAIIAADTGFGKTVTLLEAVRDLHVRSVMISAPLHTRLSWKRTAERQGIDLPFYVLDGKKAGKEAMALLKAGEPGLFFGGREFLRLQDWGGFKVDLLCVDECHSLANRQSRGAKAYRKLKRDWTVLMSATPWGSSVEGQYSVSRTVWPDEVDPSFYRWRDQWCETKFDAFAYDKKKTVGELEEGAWASNLPLYIVPKMPPLTEVIHEDVFVPLLPEQKKLYTEMESEGVAWLAEHPLVADIPIVKRTRLRQLLLGVASIRPGVKRVRNDEGVMEDVESEEVYFEDDAKSSKLSAIEEWLEDHPNESVLISTDSTRFAHIAAKRLGAFEHTGNASAKDREEAREAFSKGQLKRIVAHPATLSEGADGLQLSCHILIILSDSDSPTINRQLIGRLNRPGQTKPVVVVHVRVEGSIDDDQAENLLNKTLRIRAAELAAMPTH